MGPNKACCVITMGIIAVMIGKAVLHKHTGATGYVYALSFSAAIRSYYYPPRWSKCTYSTYFATKCFIILSKFHSVL